MNPSDSQHTDTSVDFDKPPSDHFAILEGIDAPIFVYAARGEIITSNTAWRRLSGSCGKDIQGELAWNAVASPEDRGVAKAYFTDMLMDGDSKKLELSCPADTGAQRIIEWSGSVLRDVTGIVEYVIVTGTDVTKTRDAERARRESEGRFQTITDNFPISVYRRILNEDGHRIIPYSANCMRETNELGVFDPDNPLVLGDLILSEYKEDYENAWDQSAKALTAFDFEYPLKTPSGKIRWIRNQAHPYINEGGEIIWDGIAVDITDLKNIQAKLRETFRGLEDTVRERTTELAQSNKEIKRINANLEQRVLDRTKQLQSANEDLKRTLGDLQQAQEQLVEAEKMASLGGLVAGVAHEINTPIGIGVTAASHLNDISDKTGEMLEEGTLKKASLVSYFRNARESSTIILTNLKRAADLVRSFKQVAVDQSSEERRRVQLANYLDEILLSLRPSLKKGDFKVLVDCDADIEIDSYPGAISQIVTNLIMNSTIHGYDSGESGSLKIKVDREEDEGLVRLIYSDDGKGIPQEYLDKIFDPFFTTNRGNGGSGLGLNILYNLVTRVLRGKVRCESELGRGTTFIIKFPATFPGDA
jgi:PAS domain S-box-containing protein